jgi:hypothetical protein
MIYMYIKLTTVLCMEIVHHILYSVKEFGTRKDNVPCAATFSILFRETISLSYRNNYTQQETMKHIHKKYLEMSPYLHIHKKYLEMSPYKILAFFTVHN